MKFHRILFFSLTIIHFLLSSAFQTCSPSDQTGVELTVYSTIGLVKDTRKVSLPPNITELRFMDIASSIIPESVIIKSMNHTKDLSVLEQNYEYDLISRQRLLDKYVGRELTLIGSPEDAPGIEVPAKLLSNNEGPVFKIDGEIHLGTDLDITLPRIPENLIAKPTLTMLLNNKNKAAHQLEVSYLTREISWSADYVLVLDQENVTGSLAGWVTIDNKSGTTYTEANLKLVAGDPNFVVEPLYHGTYTYTDAFNFNDYVSVQGIEGFIEEELFEYHLYDLQWPSTIKDKQQKQISLLSAENIEIEKRYIVYATKLSASAPADGHDLPTFVYVNAKNSKKNHLGTPLPKGIVRMYQPDSSGQLQFIGSDNIKHIPKDEEIKLETGKAFDITCKSICINHKKRIYGDNEEWQAIIHNHKEEDVTIDYELRQHHCKIIESSCPYTKASEGIFIFKVPVKAGEKTTLTYKTYIKNH